MCSQSYGRQYGWYNANKWFLNHYGSSNQGWEKGFDQQKVFHRCSQSILYMEQKIPRFPVIVGDIEMTHGVVALFTTEVMME